MKGVPNSQLFSVSVKIEMWLNVGADAAIVCLGLPSPWPMKAAGGGAEASAGLAALITMSMKNKMGHILCNNKGLQPGVNALAVLCMAHCHARQW